MKTVLIKWACIALAGLFIIAALGYSNWRIKSLKSDLAARNAVIMTQTQTIAALQRQLVATQIALNGWELELNAAKTAYQKDLKNVQKKIQEDESFRAWHNADLPDLGGILRQPGRD